MTDEKKKTPPAIPPMNPYIFTALVFGFGLWCFYDGFLTTDPEMQKHSIFNKVVSIPLLLYGVYDFIKTRKRQKKAKKSDE